MAINQINPNDPEGSKKNTSKKRHGSAGFIALSVALLLVIVGLGCFLWKKNQELNEKSEPFSLAEEATFSVSENTPEEVAKKIESASQESSVELSLHELSVHLSGTHSLPMHPNGHSFSVIVPASRSRWM